MGKTAAIPDDAIVALLTDRPELSPGEVAEATGISPSTTSKRLVGLESAGIVRRAPGGHDGRRRLPDRWSAVALKVTSAPRSTSAADHDAGVKRLGRGELADLVLAELAAQPTEPLGAAGIAKKLGRSSGAVANALDRLSGCYFAARSSEASFTNTDSPHDLVG